MNQVKTNLLKYLMMPLALICFAFQVHAQNVSVSGKVIDATTSNVIEGANVSVKNGQKTLTNATGSFSISVAKGANLLVSFVGYQNAQVVVNGTDLTIKLTPTTQSLEDVVVTALGVKKDAKKLGYSVQEVKGADLVKAREANPVNGLVGKVAGLDVAINQELLVFNKV